MTLCTWMLTFVLRWQYVCIVFICVFLSCLIYLPPPLYLSLSLSLYLSFSMFLNIKYMLFLNIKYIYHLQKDMTELMSTLCAVWDDLSVPSSSTRIAWRLNERHAGCVLSRNRLPRAPCGCFCSSPHSACIRHIVLCHWEAFPQMDAGAGVTMVLGLVIIQNIVAAFDLP